MTEDPRNWLGGGVAMDQEYAHTNILHLSTQAISVTASSHGKKLSFGNMLDVMENDLLWKQLRSTH